MRSPPIHFSASSRPSLAAALRIALTTGKPQLSAPVRVQGDGRLGVFAFVPVFGRGLPLRTPAERREALTGVVTGALAADALVRNAFSGLPADLDVRVTDGLSVLAHVGMLVGVVIFTIAYLKAWV